MDRDIVAVKPIKKQVDDADRSREGRQVGLDGLLQPVGEQGEAGVIRPARCVPGQASERVGIVAEPDALLDAIRLRNVEHPRRVAGVVDVLVLVHLDDDDAVRAVVGNVGPLAVDALSSAGMRSTDVGTNDVLTLRN